LPCKDAFTSMRDTACGRYCEDSSTVCSGDDYDEDDDDDCFNKFNLLIHRPVIKRMHFKSSQVKFNNQLCGQSGRIAMRK